MLSWQGEGLYLKAEICWNSSSQVVFTVSSARISKSYRKSLSEYLYGNALKNLLTIGCNFAKHCNCFLKYCSDFLKATIFKKISSKFWMNRRLKSAVKYTLNENRRFSVGNFITKVGHRNIFSGVLPKFQLLSFGPFQDWEDGKRPLTLPVFLL